MKICNGCVVYEVGTKVKLVNEHKVGRESVVHVTPDMITNWFGKEVTIKRVILVDRCPKYQVEENGWFWDNSLIAGVSGDLFVNDDDDIESASFGKFFDRFSIKHKR